MKYTITIDRPEVEAHLAATRQAKAAGKEFRTLYHMGDVDFYGGFIDLVERAFKTTLGEECTYTGFLIVVRDAAPHCHFALGVGTQIPLYGKESLRYEATEELFGAAIEGDAEPLLATLPWALSFSYNLAPRNIVLKTPKGYIKTFIPGKRTGTIWPVCSICGEKLEMFHKDETIRREHWSCPKHGEFSGVGIKTTNERPKGNVVETAEEAHRWNRHETRRIIGYLKEAQVEVTTEVVE